jgi:tetraacyldisaccharide 4'-kinase
MTRRLFLPLTPLYMAAVAAKNAAFDHGWAKARHLRRPVISVGNISVGGSGKTPFVIYLAKLLSQRGVLVDVLSRGYGRSSDAVERVDPSGDADHFGDEPLLITQAAHVPVYVGASRYAAGLLAERDDAATAVHLLDDGFQHRKLARNVDIVLIHRSDFAETLLPAGRLRESLSALKRASLLVLREEDADLEAQLKQRGIEKPIWWMRRSITVPENTGRALAFCGIAHPDEFFRSLQASGVEIAATHAFRDHHTYSSADMQALLRAARSHAANTFLTTEKDFVRLSPGLRDALTALAPVKMVKLEAHLQDETAALHQLQALLPTMFERPL